MTHEKHPYCQSHCCVIHGCKYGHEDCPVTTGKVLQDYLCEFCGVDEDSSEVRALKAQRAARSADSPRYAADLESWHDRALALPGAPDIWLRAQMGSGLVTVDGDEGLYGIASDGTWWEPTGRSDRPWVLAVDHPATEGVLIRGLGDHFVMAGKRSVLAGPPADPRLTPMSNQARCHDHEDSTLGRACIAAAAALGRWPGGEG